MLLKVVTALHTATPKGSARTFLRTMIHVNSGKCDFLLVHPKHHYGSTSLEFLQKCEFIFIF